MQAAKVMARLCTFIGSSERSLLAYVISIKNSEYDQEIPQSQTADNATHREEELFNHHETPGRQAKQPALSSPSR